MRKKMLSNNQTSIWREIGQATHPSGNADDATAEAEPVVAPWPNRAAETEIEPTSFPKPAATPVVEVVDGSTTSVPLAAVPRSPS